MSSSHPSDNKEPHQYYDTDKLSCFDVIEDMPFWKGAIIKYLWREGKKYSSYDDLGKAIDYIALHRHKGSLSVVAHIVACLSYSFSDVDHKNILNKKGDTLSDIFFSYKGRRYLMNITPISDTDPDKGETPNG